MFPDKIVGIKDNLVSDKRWSCLIFEVTVALLISLIEYCEFVACATDGSAVADVTSCRALVA